MHVVGIKQIIERALVSYSGVTTSDGGALGATLVDSNLSIDYDGQTVLITSGSYTGQARDIDGDTSSGTVTPSSNFGGVIVAGTTFLILSGIPAMAEFDDIKGTGWTNENLTTIDSLIDAIKAITDALPNAGALTTLITHLTELKGAGFDTATDSLVKIHDDHAALLTGVRISELDAAKIPADIDTLLTRITAAVALASSLTTHDTDIKALLANVALEATLGTHDTDIKTLLATIAGYLDTEIAAILAAVDTEVAGILALVDSAEAAGPYSYLDAGLEQDVVEDTAVTRRRIFLEFSNRNMTLAGTFRIYRKVDGANYDLYVTVDATVAAGADRAWDAEFTTNQAWKLTYEESADEGAARAIPYNVITQVIE